MWSRTHKIMSKVGLDPAPVVLDPLQGVHVAKLSPYAEALKGFKGCVVPDGGDLWARGREAQAFIRTFTATLGRRLIIAQMSTLDLVNGPRSGTIGASLQPAAWPATCCAGRA
jgi:hypothetical protein